MAAAVHLLVGGKLLFLRYLTWSCFSVVAGLRPLPHLCSVSQVVDLGTLVPSVSIDPEYLMALIAVLGTTISPYLFFWETPQEVEDVPNTGRNQSERLKPLGARRHARRDRLVRDRRHSAAELSVCPGPGSSTRLWARSHRATKCHAEVQH
jgi:Natural resistance-associated macrophage protein